MPTSSRPHLAVAICTFHRNEPLHHLLSTLQRIAAADREHYALGVVVVDDSAEQLASAVVAQFAGAFECGIEYRHSGKRNISLARNLVLETALETGAEWIAMTDDDCEPSNQWLTELLHVQHKTGADIVTGPLIRRAPPGAPRWLHEQPFLALSAFEGEDGRTMDLAFTNNSMIPARLLTDSRNFRFNPDYGRIGGEDMVFYRAVAKAGYRIVFAANAVVCENEEADRLSLGYQMRRHFWIGNSSVHTSMENGAGRARMLVHGLATAARAVYRPIGRILQRERPQLLYGGAKLCEAAGKLAGVVGLRVKHK